MPGTLVKGMCNFPVNMTEDEHLELGRVACAKDVPTGQFIRQMYLEGLKVHYPEIAAKIELIRHSRRVLKASFVMLAGLLTFGQFVGHIDMRRQSSRCTRTASIRVVRSVRRETQGA